MNVGIKENIKRELCIMIAHYIRDKNPDIYSQLRTFLKQKNILPNAENDINSILDVRFSSFQPDQFLQFLKTLTPEDDYPSIFRRMVPFPKTLEFTSLNCNINLLCSHCFHTDPIFSIEIDPLSRFFVTGSDDNTMKIISLPSFREVLKLSGHRDVISNLYINFDISLLLSSSHDKTVRIWSLNTGQCLAVLSNITTSDIHYALFSPNGKLIAAACEDGAMCLWKTEDALKQKPPFHKIMSPELTPVVWLAFSPGSEFLGYVAEPNRVIILSMSTNKSFELRYHNGKITYVTFSRRLYPSNFGMAPKIMTFSDEDGSVSIWSIGRNGYFVPAHVYKPPTTGRKNKILATCWDYDDHLIVIVRQGNIVIFDSLSGKCIQSLPDTEEITNSYLLANNPKSPNLFVFVTTTGIFSVWDVHEIILLTTVTDKSEAIYHEVKWSPCGKYIIASDNNGRVLIFVFTSNGHKCSLIQYSEPNRKREMLNYQVNTDMTFFNNCEKEEIVLAQNLKNLNGNEEIENIGHDLNIHVQQPPNRIKVVLKPPMNPDALHKDDDRKVFHKNENDNTINYSNNYAQKYDTNNSSTDKQLNELENVYDNFMFESSFENQDENSNLIPQPFDQIYFEIYPPFERLNKPRWLTAISSTVYVPQVGDQVFYIHEANTHGLIEPTDLNGFSFSEMTRAQIVKLDLIDFGYIVTLDSPNITFKIPFTFEEYCDYLFLVSIIPTFSQKIRKLKIGTKITYRVNSFKYQGEVVSKKKNAVKSLYNCILVSNADSELNISPWQILEIDSNPVSLHTSNPYLGTGKSVPSATALDAIALGNEFSQFYDMSEKLCANDAKPMDMKFILERLNRGWYRSKLALENDICCLAEITKVDNSVANKLIDQCLSAIKRSII
ncbi:hypothetical protein TRFO_39994 [Tritrichomonas foetus]|uniref:Uncharacterized protein n=1 Tax=Tritrichomonas foetus TaxID=1144522 RepID=A0A1J4J2S4_9EUKA|nr:hypothetical protein TRFO_39994 [Tritrichomonas foetus]|eukprot:OHS93726.1 hypothetical protein TRFO_39994 [Tritrichomonas foetus]